MYSVWGVYVCVCLCACECVPVRWLRVRVGVRSHAPADKDRPCPRSHPRPSPAAARVSPGLCDEGRVPLEGRWPLLPGRPRPLAMSWFSPVLHGVWRPGEAWLLRSLVPSSRPPAGVRLRWVSPAAAPGPSALSDGAEQRLGGQPRLCSSTSGLDGREGFNTDGISRDQDRGESARPYTEYTSGLIAKSTIGV